MSAKQRTIRREYNVAKLAAVGRNIMRSSHWLLLWLFSVAIPLPSQNVNLKHPQEIEAQKPTTPEDMRARAAYIQLQKDAKELADLCASVSDDMNHVKQGLLPKDSMEKLKRLEKLTKRVREELAQTSTAP